MKGPRLLSIAIVVALTAAGLVPPGDACLVGEQSLHACCDRPEPVVQTSCCEAPQPTPDEGAACQCAHGVPVPIAVVAYQPTDTERTGAVEAEADMDALVQPSTPFSTPQPWVATENRPPPLFLHDCAFLI